MDFLSENCLCGKTLLHLVAKGNSVIAELLRLFAHTPSEFRNETKIYRDILPDFSYLKSPKSFEDKISASNDLQKLDQEVFETHRLVIERTYSAFESIHKYGMDLVTFLEELEEGVYVQMTMEEVFNNRDGKQLMCEMLYLYGVMLLITEQVFPGEIRERLIVSHLRHSEQKSSSGASIDDVCKLLRSSNLKKSQTYPEEFFRNIVIDPRYVDLVIDYIRSDDIYHQVDSYPSPDHRTTAFASQAGLLYVCLYFKPTLLSDNYNRMRELVDKFFSDNWIISYYMGWTVNLLDVWAPFKAAKQALINALTPDTVHQIAHNRGSNLLEMLHKTDLILADGPLSEKKVINQSGELITLLTECNVALRWFILHQSSVANSTNSAHKKIIQAKTQALNDLSMPSNAVFELLLNVSVLELSLSDAYKKVLQDKQQKWQSFKEVASKQCLDLSEAFDGTSPLARVSKNKGLTKWFKQISEQISDLDLDDSTIARLKMTQIIQAMRQVKDLHNMHQSAGVVQAIETAVNRLEAMSKVSRIKEDHMISLALISDLSYAWKIINEYTSVMQESIKRDPSQVGRLRAAFLKLASGLELPLIRINQAKSPDMVSVSAYYSGVLVDYIKKVLQVIPKSMFETLKEIAHLQTKLKTIPVRLEKEKVKEFAQFEDRHQLAVLTHRVAVLGEGVSMMKSTLVGVVQIDPKTLLEDGIRQEIVTQVSQILHQGIIFNSKQKTKTLETQLDEINEEMAGFRESFEHVQDYLNIFGLRIWQEELRRIIEFNIKQECKHQMGRRVSTNDVGSTVIVIPHYKPLDSDGVNFMGRLMSEILRNTNPKSTVFVPEFLTWYDSKTRKETFSQHTCKKILLAMGVPGVNGLIQMVTFLVTKELQDTIQFLEEHFSRISDCGRVVEEIKQNLNKSASMDKTQRMFSTWIQKCNKSLTSLLDKIQHIGRLQLIHGVANVILQYESRSQCKLYTSILENLQRCVLSEAKRKIREPDCIYFDKEGRFTHQLNDFLDQCGLSDHLYKVYITSKPLQWLPEILLLLLVANNTKIYYSSDIGSLVGIRGNEGIDGSSLITGILTLCRQFHSDYLEHLLKILSQYCESVTSNAFSGSNSSAKDIPQEIATTVFFIKELLSKASRPAEDYKYLPIHLQFVPPT